MFQHIRPDELAHRQQAGEKIYLLDVRQLIEHQFAALPNSVLIPLHELPSRLDEVRPETGQAIVVYCHHGIRSMRGAEFLASKGFENVYSLMGGIDAWSIQIDPQVPRYG